MRLKDFDFFIKSDFFVNKKIISNYSMFFIIEYTVFIN